MMKQLLSLYLMTLAIFSGSMMAQAPFFQKNESKASVIRYNQGSQQAITNHLLSRLSQGNNTAIGQTRIIISHDENLTLSRLNQYEMRVEATIENFQVDGNTDYRGFDVADYLRPTAITFRLIHRNGLSKVKNDWKFDEVAINGNSSPVANFNLRDSSNFRMDKLEMVDKAFLYKQATKDLFDSHLLRIDEYYQASQELETTYQQLLAIRPDDIDGIYDQQRQLNAVLQQVDAIRQKGYEERLQLGPQNDPAQFVPRFNDVQQLGGQLQQQIQGTIAQLPVLYYERGMDALNRGDRNQAVRDFNRSVEMAPDFAPAHLQLGLISYRDGNVQVGVDRILNMLRTMNPDPDTRAQAMPVLQEIQGQALADVRAANQAKNPEQALSLIESTSGLCNEFPELNCAEGFMAEARQAHKLIYEGHIRTTGQQLSARQFDQAEQSALAAINYQSAHADFLPNALEAEAMLTTARRGIFQGMLDNAANLLNRGLFDRSEAVINEALAYQLQHPTAITSDAPARELQARLYVQQYQSLVRQGGQAMSNQQWQSALDRFEQAMNLEVVHGVVADSTVPGMAREAARNVAIEKLNRALQLAGSNRLGEARQTASEAQILRDRYGLNADDQLNGLQAQLGDAIFSQECVNAQTEYDNIVARAASFRRANDYIKAEATYEEALNQAAANAACGINTEAVRSAQTEIAPSAKYQRSMINVNQMVDRSMHRDAVTAYLAAGREYEANHLDAFGFIHAPLADFILNSGRSNFVLFGANYYMDEKDLDTALEFMRRLAQVGYPKGNMKSTQIRLGTELAMRDFAQNPNSNYKSKGVQYMGGYSALKFIYKGYKKQWKRMG